MHPSVTMNTRDGVITESQKRLWFAREEIMGVLQGLGMPVSVDGSMVIIRNVESTARWLTVSSHDGISALFADAKFNTALDQFRMMSPPMTVRHILPPGITINGRGIDIDGSAMRVKFPTGGSAEDGPELFVIPVNRKAMSTGTEWIEMVALIPQQLLEVWKFVQLAANMADRTLNVSNMTLRVYNGPDMQIQPVSLEDIVMEESVRDGFANDIASFLSRRDFYDSRGLPWSRKYILSGEPGTGKTSLMRWACTSLGLPSMAFDFSDPYADGRTFAGCLATAARMAPCILTLDELDKVLAGDNATRIGPRTLHTALSGMGNMDGVIVVATCNDPSLLVQGAMARRFDVMIDVPLPSPKLRRVYLDRMLSEDAVTPEFMDRAVQATDGWSYSDLMSAVTAAANNVTSRRGNLIEDVDLTYGISQVESKRDFATK